MDRYSREGGEDVASNGGWASERSLLPDRSGGSEEGTAPEVRSDRATGSDRATESDGATASDGAMTSRGVPAPSADGAASRGAGSAAGDPPGDGWSSGATWASSSSAESPAAYGSTFEPRDERDYDPHAYRPEQKPWWKRWFGWLVPIGIILFSWGAKLKGLLLLLPKLKFVTTGLSMFVSIGAYTLLWTWKFALGFVLLLFVHEMGHVLQLRREGIKASAPMFIPFMGAFVGMKELPKDAGAEARVGLAGPVLGTLGILVPLGLYFATGNDLFRALAFMGFFLNLINLLPVLPLDGGRALQALSPWVTFAGFLGFVVLAYLFPHPIMLLVLLFGGLETWRRFRSRNSEETQRFNSVPLRTRMLVAATYLALVIVLAAGMDLSFVPRPLGGV